MANKRLKRPRDLISLAKLVGDIATGQAQDTVESKHGSAGRQKGGLARSARLTPEQREDIARIAAQARWKKS